MNRKRKQKPNGDTQTSKASVEQSISFLKFILAATVQSEQRGTKPELDHDVDWETWRTCRHIAGQSGNQLAGILAAPALAVIPLIEQLIWKTGAGLRSKSLNDEQRKEAANLSEQLDFALALIHRNLGYLISWRGQHTSSSDLFCEAWVVAKGDSSKAARLIRRCVKDFPGEVAPQSENIVDSFAWETYQRVQELDRFADEFPDQIRTAAVHMHGWPMIRQRHHDNRVRFEALAEQFKLGSAYPLDTSKNARFRADTPMVRYLDSMVCHLDYVRGMTGSTKYASVETEKEPLRQWWRDGSVDEPKDAVLEILRVARGLPPLTKATAREWAKKVIVPLVLAGDGSDYRSCKEKALQQVAKQTGVKSQATFKSRLLAAVAPTLTSMARPG